MFELPNLPYAADALEPWIDAATMHIHREKHQQAYVTNLNAAIEKQPSLAKWSLEDLLGKLSDVPEDSRVAVRNHGGGVWNHNLFWQIMGPAGGAGPSTALQQAISSTWGDMAKFKAEFEKAAMGRFGSGWAWMVKGPTGLAIMSTANQDNPMSDGLTPVLGLDVWEHAYYLKYQNRRAEYVANWWNVVNWPAVSQRFGK